MRPRRSSIAVLMPNHFNKELFKSLRDCIVGSGGEILIVGFAAGEPLTDSTRKEVVAIDVAADKLNLGEYSALIVLDSSTPEEMIASKTNLNLILRSYENQKVIGAVDRGVELLVAALGTLLSGRRLTGPSESRIDLEGVGSNYADEHVVVDKYLITAKSSGDIKQFCNSLLDIVQSLGGLAA